MYPKKLKVNRQLREKDAGPKKTMTTRKKRNCIFLQIPTRWLFSNMYTLYCAKAWCDNINYSGDRILLSLYVHLNGIPNRCLLAIVSGHKENVIISMNSHSLSRERKRRWIFYASFLFCFLPVSAHSWLVAPLLRSLFVCLEMTIMVITSHHLLINYPIHWSLSSFSRQIQCSAISGMVEVCWSNCEPGTLCTHSTATKKWWMTWCHHLNLFFCGEHVFTYKCINILTHTQDGLLNKANSEMSQHLNYSFFHLPFESTSYHKKEDTWFQNPGLVET